MSFGDSFERREVIDVNYVMLACKARRALRSCLSCAVMSHLGSQGAKDT